ncbi:Bug family tripartite tricarboxylate transporter substrate binding protein [Candidimonas nitroreducens]|uniref:ABC transporter substrate-binding protein n=1 Tax=Candidimonas nitroreducens TaxID=683354 RepID=A0A225MKE0_9BURK|nr:tripartite tricarboxylate transporter substrate binding protein [Candidimonas nitroreducens]OWT61708.1 ABC transporter substrate-binding protein [Candidimonas nitroreducens]
MKLNRIAIGLVVAAFSVIGTARADYPNRAINLIVPNPPGATNDKLGRMLGQWLNKYLKQPVVIENRAGAAMAIGTQYVANSPPDGYTLLLGGASAFVTNPLVRSDLRYNFHRDFKTVALIAKSPMIFLANPSSSFKSMQDVVQTAEKHPGEVMYATAGSGSSLNIATEGLAADAGIRLEHIPYQGSAPAMLAVVKGEVPLMTEVVSGAVAYIKSGQVRGLGVGSAQRLPLLPNVPTVEEATGIKNFRAGTWWSLTVPHATPQPIIEKLRHVVDKILVDPSFQAIFQNDGLTIAAPMSLAETQDYMDSEVKRWATLYKTVESRLAK